MPQLQKSENGIVEKDGQRRKQATGYGKKRYGG